MIERLRGLLARWRESADPHIGLDSLLAHAQAEAPIEERLEWLHDLVAWLLSPSASTTVRLKHLTNVLERNPERRHAVAAMLRSTMAERDALDLLTETGLPREVGFFGEFLGRLLTKLLPEPPPKDLARLFTRIFPDADDAWRLESIEEDVWLAALAILDEGSEGDRQVFRARLVRSAEDAVELLAIQVSATTQASNLRSRMETAPAVPLPTEALPFIVERFVMARRAADAQALETERENLRTATQASLLAVEHGYETLDRQGVSIGIVYQLERVRHQIQRLDELAQLLADPTRGRPLLRYFLASLVRDVHAHRDVGPLLRQNFSLVARKIVERNAETGEHYIARDGKEYADIFRRALGGGMLTALTVHVKLALAHFKFAAFFEGFLASVNYAVSFVAIQLSGFTLATKQPAMTGPALARKMKRLDEEGRLDDFVDEVANLMRSQVGAILGNLIAVAPVAVGICYVFANVGAPVMNAEKALASIDSFSILGPTLLFAAFTGVLLWLSSVFAGWADNWFFYRELGPAIASHRRLRYSLGPTRAKAFADFLEREIAGLAGNVSLGFMLGSIPVLMVFFGIPLDVRHVTLSTGQLAVAVATLGFESMARPAFWMAVAGIVGIGFLNLTVSFALALAVAIRAREIPAPGRRAVYGALLRRVVRRPLSFVFAK